MPISNQAMKSYEFLTDMYDDEYFPDFLVDKCRDVLVQLCEQIEDNDPQDEDSLFELTHGAVDLINALEGEFNENDSELETGAREALAEDFAAILEAYGFAEVDLEEAISNREW